MDTCHHMSDSVYFSECLMIYTQKQYHESRDGNGAGRAEGWDLRSRPVWFCLALSPSRPA